MQANCVICNRRIVINANFKGRHPKCTRCRQARPVAPQRPQPVQDEPLPPLEQIYAEMEEMFELLVQETTGTSYTNPDPSVISPDFGIHPDDDAIRQELQDERTTMT